MANKETPEEAMSDKQERPYMVATTNVQQAWPIAHIDAYREIAPELVRLHDSLSAGSGTSMFPVALQQQVMLVLDRINDLTQQRWAEYVKAGAAHPLEAESLRDMGVPEHITYDSANGVPFLNWMTYLDGPVPNWREIEVNIKEDVSGQTFQFVPPFRPVHVNSLPGGTHRLPINDPVHAATIAVYEVIDSSLTNLLRASTTVSPRDNWVRMQITATLYRTIAQARLKELSMDDYKDWVVTIPETIPIFNAPAQIARLGANAVVIQILALRTIAGFVQDSMDRADKEPINVDQAAKVDQVIGEMTNYRDRMKARADNLNALVVSDSPIDPKRYDVMVVSRPFPRGTPFIALIPRGSSAKKVKKLRAPSSVLTG